MQSPKPSNRLYSEQEAADLLGVSLFQLRNVLDRHVFNDIYPRPERVQLLYSDVLLLEYWIDQNKATAGPANVLAMQKRG
jgi:hypothetical protein